MRKQISIGLVGLFLVILVACSSGNRYHVDISNVTVDMPFHRFDKELYRLSPDSALPLFNRYPRFSELYAYRIIKIGNPYSVDFPQRLRVFKTDYVVGLAYDEVEKKFADLSEFKQQLLNAFKCYHTYFPGRVIPAVYTFVSGFNQAIAIDSNILAIGLDFYLGNHCKYYTELAFPQYRIRKMTPEYMLHDALWGWLTAEFPVSETENNLLAKMIYAGKIQYLMRQCLPVDYPDSLLFAISSQKLDWCKDHETQMWTYFIDKKLLFTHKYLDVKKFMDEGPFTTPFGRQSPARTGVWIGARIVEAYMKHNPSVTIQELMQETNSQKILTLSQYNP